MAERVKSICQAEGVEIDENSAREIARLAEGSVRDAISLLEQAIVYSDGKVSLEMVHELFRLSSPAKIVDLSVSLLAEDLQKVSELAQEMVDAGRDPEHTILELASLFEKYLLNRAYLKQAVEARNLPYPQVSDSALISAISECWEASNRLRREANPTLLFKITALHLANILKAPEEPKVPASSLRSEGKDLPNAELLGEPAKAGSRKRAQKEEPLKGKAEESSVADTKLSERFAPSEIEMEPSASASEPAGSEEPSVPDEDASEVLEELSEEETEELGDFERVSEAEETKEEFPEGDRTAPLFEPPEKLRRVMDAISGSAVVGDISTTDKPRGRGTKGRSGSESSTIAKASPEEKAENIDAYGKVPSKAKEEKGDADSPRANTSHASTLSQDERWQNLLASVRKESLTTFCLLFESAIPRLESGVLILDYPYYLRFFAQLVQQADNMRVLSHFAKKFFGDEVEVRVQVLPKEVGDEEVASQVNLAKEIFPEAKEVDLV